MELSASCPISTIYAIFFPSTSLKSRFPKTPILADETCGARSVIKPFENYTLILSLCPALFWPTFEVRFDSGRNIQVCYFQLAVNAALSPGSE
jgi:hypothetical protein